MTGVIPGETPKVKVREAVAWQVQERPPRNRAGFGHTCKVNSSQNTESLATLGRHGAAQVCSFYLNKNI